MLAWNWGTTIVPQDGSVKGWAVRTGLKLSQPDFVVMLDTECTYPACMIPDFLSMVDGGVDVVVGSRLSGSIDEGR